eukprot:COSAG05_NODE_3607_length_1963_cov_2.597639_2_plen_237_part_00
MRIDSPWAMVGCLLAVLILATQAYLHTAHADADHATDGRMFLVAVTVALRRSAASSAAADGSSSYQVRTQRRMIINKKYDPLYDGTHETIGETVKKGESIVSAVVRGVAEELGFRGGGLRIVGAEGNAVSTTHTVDPVLSIESPYCFVQQLGPPQPWTGLGFVALLPPNVTLEGDGEGEVGEGTWWEPAELLHEMQSNKPKFMGFHYPVLKKVSQDLVDGTLQPRLLEAAEQPSPP